MNLLHQPMKSSVTHTRRLIRELPVLQFASLGVMKNAVREIKERPGGVLRAGKYIQRHPAIHASGVPTTSSYLPPSIAPMKVHVEAGVLANARGLSIAKGAGADAGLATRRQALLHESGHQADPRFEAFIKRGNRVQDAMMAGRLDGGALARSPSQRFIKEHLNRERQANRNAVGLLQRSGASGPEIQDYRRAARRAFKTYKMNYIGQTMAQDTGVMARVMAAQGQAGGPVAASRPIRAAVKDILRQKPHLRGYGFAARQSEVRCMAGNP